MTAGEHIAARTAGDDRRRRRLRESVGHADRGACAGDILMRRKEFPAAATWPPPSLHPSPLSVPGSPPGHPPTAAGLGRELDACPTLNACGCKRLPPRRALDSGQPAIGICRRGRTSLTTAGCLPDAQREALVLPRPSRPSPASESRSVGVSGVLPGTPFYIYTHI
jgi:hypothetical protein